MCTILYIVKMSLFFYFLLGVGGGKERKSGVNIYKAFEGLKCNKQQRLHSGLGSKFVLVTEVSLGETQHHLYS